MKVAHSIKISVFTKPEDDKEKIKKGLLSLVPFDIEKEGVFLEEKKAQGFDDREIVIYTIALKKDRHIREFTNSLFSRLDDRQKQLLKRQTESRVDDDCNFFIRLDKEKLLDGGLLVTDSGNCYHVKIQIAAFPSRKEAAVKAAEALIGA